MFEEISQWANGLQKYSFDELYKLKSVNNGIYLVFEAGEQFGTLDRIVRVGSHPTQNRFYKRLLDHFTKRQRASIMRKHIGRCFLNKEKDSYIAIWNFNNMKVKKGQPGQHLLDQDKEAEIENKISEYLKNFSLVVIPFLNNKSKRLELENKLIVTLKTKSKGYISTNWLGSNHPNLKISESGLWNIHGLNHSELLTQDDFNYLKSKTEHV